MNIAILKQLILTSLLVTPVIGHAMVPVTEGLRGRQGSPFLHREPSVSPPQSREESYSPPMVPEEPDYIDGIVCMGASERCPSCTQLITCGGFVVAGALLVGLIWGLDRSQQESLSQDKLD